MKICIIQPSYIPWKGYFHQISQADCFVFLDTVQYDKRGWRNRNQIKTSQGPSWLTIPVHAHGTHNGLLIQNVLVQDANWAQSHLQKIRLSYQKAPFFDQEFSWLREILLDIAQNDTHISRITAKLTMAIAQRIGIQNTQFLYASEIPIETSSPSDRLLRIVQVLGGSSYLSGPSAQSYLDVSQFEIAGVSVEWMRYNYPVYPQLYPPFTHQVSILDLMLMVGSEQVGSYIWKHNPESQPESLMHESSSC
jgi:hypothetical protein